MLRSFRRRKCRSELTDIVNAELLFQFGYLVDGHALAMNRQEVTVTVRDPAGQLSTVTRTLYISRYGPVLGGDWTTANAFEF